MRNAKIETEFLLFHPHCDTRINIHLISSCATIYSSSASANRSSSENERRIEEFNCKYVLQTWCTWDGVPSMCKFRNSPWPTSTSTATLSSAMINSSSSSEKLSVNFEFVSPFRGDDKQYSVSTYHLHLDADFGNASSTRKCPRWWFRRSV